MPRTLQTAFRLSPATRRQLEWLAAQGYGSLTAAMEAAVHHLYEAQRPVDDMRWIRPLIETSGVLAVLELSLEQVRALSDEDARRAYERYMEFLR